MRIDLGAQRVHLHGRLLADGQVPRVAGCVRGGGGGWGGAAGAGSGAARRGRRAAFSYGNDWYSVIHLLDATTSNPGEEWNVTLPISVVTDIEISADGSTIVVGHQDLNPTLRVSAYAGQDGSPLAGYEWSAPFEPATGGLVSVSANGQYVGVLYGNQQGEVFIDVLDDGGNIHTFTQGQINNTYGQAFAISPTGKYVVAGQANVLQVYQQVSTSPLKYGPLFTITDATETFYVSSNSISFAPDAEYVCVGWQNIQQNPSEQPLIQGYLLPNATAALNYTFPTSSGSYPNWPVGCRVSSLGKYVAFASWGSGATDPGSQQLQVFGGFSGHQGPVGGVFTTGSMFAVEIATQANGKTIAMAGGKAVHATVLGNGGQAVVAQVFP
jgi:hypothetical protein